MARELTDFELLYEEEETTGGEVGWYDDIEYEIIGENTKLGTCTKYIGIWLKSKYTNRSSFFI